MEKKFWLARWEREEIGFHEREVNAYLSQFWHELNLEHDDAVFVPLCGKSLDLKWLREQGHPVVGVELSRLAVQAFFNEHGYTSACSVLDKFECIESNEIRLLCGDFFDLTRRDLVNAKAVFDRASMIALPLEMRQRYAQHLINILPSKAKILLIAIDYPQEEMMGPPFALSSEEIVLLFGENANIKHLAKYDVLEENPRFKRRGLTSMFENIYLLTLID